MKRILFIFALSFFGFYSNSAEAIVTLHFVGSYMNDTTSVSGASPGTSMTGGSGSCYGGGLLLDLGLIPSLGLRTGALYVQRKNTVNTTAGAFNISQTANMTDVQVPALLTYSLIPMIDIQAGAVFNMAQGSLSLDQNDPNNLNGGTFTGHSLSYSQMNMPSSDTALDFGMNLYIPIGTTWSLLLNANYQLGLTSMDSTGSTTQKLNIFQALLGFSYPLL